MMKNEKVYMLTYEKMKLKMENHKSIKLELIFITTRDCPRARTVGLGRASEDGLSVTTKGPP